MKQKVCYDSQALCTVLMKDLHDLRKMEIKFPGKVHLVKFEDLASYPNLTMNNLFEKLNIEWDHAVQAYIQKHTTVNNDEPWSRYRISGLRINQWKTELDSIEVHKIQKYCFRSMKTLNYSTIA